MRVSANAAGATRSRSTGANKHSVPRSHNYQNFTSDMCVSTAHQSSNDKKVTSIGNRHNHLRVGTSSSEVTIDYSR